MKTYQSFGALARALTRSIEEMPATFLEVAETGAELVREGAKAKIGHYQEAAGPFPKWAELKDATKADRVRQGFSENDPLLRTGELRDSIKSEATPAGFIVGSASPIAEYQGLGTAHIPPRPFLSSSLFESAPAVVTALGSAVELTIAGSK